MDQLICAYLSHTHYRYEVGMLTVPAYNKPVAPIAQRRPRNLRTRWGVSLIPVNGIFLKKKYVETLGREFDPGKRIFSH